MYLHLNDFLEHAAFPDEEKGLGPAKHHQRGVPDIVIVAVYLIYGHEILDLYLQKILMIGDHVRIENWPKPMPGDDDYYIFCHKQVRKEGELFVPADFLVPRTVIRRSLALPMVVSTFRRSIIQHINFFHDFLLQSVSYNKTHQIDGRRPKILLSRFFLKLVKPLFCQLCDPYTSYNEGVYGITLRQFTS